MNFSEIASKNIEPAKSLAREVSANKSALLGDISASAGIDNSKMKIADDRSDLTQSSVVAATVLNKKLLQTLNVKNDLYIAPPDNTELNHVRPGPSEKVEASVKDSQEKPFFDFAAVASNVLKFVGSALQKASDKGASQEELAEKIEQAKAGVASGIKLAQDDLGELLNPVLEKGIEEAESEIAEGIEGFEQKYLADVTSAIVGNLSEQTQASQESDILIKTANGDEVSIQLSSLQGSRAQLSSQQNDDTKDVQASSQTSRSLNYSVSVEGNVDESELKAVGELVGKLDDVASQFFYGDIENSFESALALGFDNQQLTSFALQLRQNESFQKIQQYGEVQFAGDSNKTMSGNSSPKSVAQYMNKMLDVMEQSKQLLEGDQEYNTLINGLVNEMKDVQVPDLLTAINKFHSFSAKLFEQQANS